MMIVEQFEFSLRMIVESQSSSLHNAWTWLSSSPKMNSDSDLTAEGQSSGLSSDKAK
jgi:hypothetical protein